MKEELMSIEERIILFLDGELNELESKLLMEEIESNPDARFLLEEYQQVYLNDEEKVVFDEKSALLKTGVLMDMNTKTIWAAAASVVLLMTLTVFWSLFKNTEEVIIEQTATAHNTQNIQKDLKQQKETEAVSIIKQEEFLAQQKKSGSSVAIKRKSILQKSDQEHAPNYPTVQKNVVSENRNVVKQERWEKINVQTPEARLNYHQEVNLSYISYQSESKKQVGINTINETDDIQVLVAGWDVSKKLNEYQEFQEKGTDLKERVVDNWSQFQDVSINKLINRKL